MGGSERVPAEDTSLSGRDPNRPLRLLFLCGNRSNNEITELQAGFLKFEEYGIKVDFLEGPFTSSEAYHPSVEEMLPNASWYTWTQSQGEPWTWESLSAALVHVSKYVDEHGPYDGVAGFSTGGLVAAMVASDSTMSAQVCAPSKTRRTRFRFMMAICSIDCDEGEAGPWQGCSVPSFHLIGAQDSLAPLSRKLANACAASAGNENVIVYEMAYAGHEVPAVCLNDDALHANLQRLFARIRR
eukprot:TRINITY_DN7381_c0_g1_i2.p1 TRINITY_DN7381_c0_g1~~TRINITY_DN7381_c0_g1_i2.p1  ORF type:complete len:242 (-),score=32.16 TRINITY_DN7381_c0_g1_i2:76-801(-)